MKESTNILLYKINSLHNYVDDFDLGKKETQLKIIERIRELVKKESIDTMLMAESVFFYCKEQIEDENKIEQEIHNMLQFMI